MRSGSRPRQQMPLLEPSPSLWRAIFTSLPIVVALILLPTIAFASPPDPSWIAGIYDGADGDDIVSLVYETSAASAAAPLHVGPLPCRLGIFLEGIDRSHSSSSYTRGPRSPPVRSSTEFAYVFSSLPPPAPGTEALATPPSIIKARLSHRGDRPALRFLHRSAQPHRAAPRDIGMTRTGERILCCPRG